MGRWSVNEFTTFRWSFEDDVRSYAAAGFDAVGVWQQKLSDFGEEKGAEWLAEAGLTVSSLHWIGGFTGSDGRGFSDSLRDAKSSLRVAQLLGAQTVMVHSGSLNGHIRRHAHRLLRDALEGLLPLAEEFNATLVLKPIPAPCAGPWTFLHDFDAACRLIDELASPHVRLVFDTYYHGWDRSLVDHLPRIVDYIGLVQIADAGADPGAAPERYPPGAGSLPLGTLLARLENAGYRGCYEFEVWGDHLSHLTYHELLLCCAEAARRWERQLREAPSLRSDAAAASGPNAS